MMNNQLQQGDDNYDSDDESYSSYYSDDAIVNSDDESIKNDNDYLDYETKEWLQRNQFNRRQKEKEQNVSAEALDDMTRRPPVNMSIPLINPWNKKDSKDCPIMSLTDIMECQTKETEEENLRIEKQKRQKQEQAKKKRSFHFGNGSSSNNTSSSGNSTKPRFNLKHNKNSKEEGASKPRFITKKKV